MCAINPTHKKRLIVDVYTADLSMSKEYFEKQLLEWALDFELRANTNSGLRWHVKETEQ